MPYIADKDREHLEPISDAIYAQGVETAGELQYIIAVAITEFMHEKGEIRYQHCNDVMGALTGAQAEFYRRVVGPYEDKCIAKNGDVPGYTTNIDGEEY